MVGLINILVKLFERFLGIFLDVKWVREIEVDFLKKEYVLFFGDDVYGNLKILYEFEEYDKVSSECVDCFLVIYFKVSKY